MYLYLLNDDVEALNAFKTYMVEVEKQKEKKIKTIRSNRGWMYYGRYTKNEEIMGLFAKFLEEECIVAQYSMFDIPQQNHVVQRMINCTLIGMVRCKIRNYNLPLSFSIEALKTVVYILSRKWMKTKFKSFRRIGLSSWSEDLQSTFICKDNQRIFISYAINSKVFRFYYSSYNIRVVESRNTKFLDDAEPSRSLYSWRIELEEVQELAKSPSDEGRLIVLKENQIDYFEPQLVLKQPTHEE